MEPAPGKQDLKKETDVVNNEKKTNRNGNNKAPKQKGQDGVSHGHEYKYEDWGCRRILFVKVRKRVWKAARNFENLAWQVLLHVASVIISR